MTAKNLSTVTNEVITSYANTAKHVIHAYRAGGERAVSAVEASWKRALRQSRPHLDAEVAKNAAALQQTVSGFTLKGLSITSGSANSAVNAMEKMAEAGIDRLAANASMFEEKTGVFALSTLAQAARPGAQALCNLAMQVETSTAGFAKRVVGR